MGLHHSDRKSQMQIILKSALGFATDLAEMAYAMISSEGYRSCYDKMAKLIMELPYDFITAS